MSDKQSKNKSIRVEKSTSDKNIIAGMDSNNKNAMKVLVNEGHNAFVRHCFTHPETGRPLSYAEMRGFYG